MKSPLKIASGLLLLGLLAGCSSSSGSHYYGSDVISYGSTTYASGFYDPWYYGGYRGATVIVTPPRDNYPVTLPARPQPSYLR